MQHRKYLVGTGSWLVPGDLGISENKQIRQQQTVHVCVCVCVVSVIVKKCPVQ